MSRTESNDNGLLSAVRNLIVTDDQGNVIDEEAVINLHNADTLNFKLVFASPPEASEYRVTLVIHKRGRSSAVDSGEIRNARTATTFTQTRPVLDSPPRIQFDVVDTGPHPFHDGPGPYETTIALTPIDAGGKPVESETSSVSYDFTGIEP